MFNINQKVKIVSAEAEILKQFVGSIGIYTSSKGAVRADYTLIQIDGGKAIFCNDSQLEAV